LKIEGLFLGVKRRQRLMHGTIFEINKNRGMVGVLTENGDFSIFELLSGDTVEKGDEVLWENDTGLGDEVITKLTQGESFEVYFQNHYVSKSQLSQQLLY
jgi:hypothetical protein